MKLLIKVCILSIALIVILKSCSPYSNAPNSLVGQDAPDFILETISGKQISMTQFRGNQPAMIFFWATWCPHCRKQLKELTQNRLAIEEKEIKIILVDVGESTRKVQEYIRANNISFDVFLDVDGKVAKAYKLVGVPTFFFINGEGIILEVGNVLPDNYREVLLRRQP